MRFRFWRSWAFWLGLPGLLFLAWGWWHSMGHYAGIGVIGPEEIRIGQMAGEVGFFRMESMNSGRWSLDFSNEEGTAVELSELKSMYLGYSEKDPDFHVAFIPYPYVILAYLAVWGGVLVWRGRRYRRAGGS